MLLSDDGRTGANAECNGAAAAGDAATDDSGDSVMLADDKFGQVAVDSSFLLSSLVSIDLSASTAGGTFDSFGSSIVLL